MSQSDTISRSISRPGRWSVDNSDIYLHLAWRILDSRTIRQLQINFAIFQTGQAEEAEALQRKNAELKLRVGQMEDLLERLKSKFVEKVANPSSLKI